jgi:dihydroflavonol-4-reductase
MQVLVTGANGHIGCHIVRALRAAGHVPVGFVRPGSDRRALGGSPCELRGGDLLEPASILRALGGIDAIVHAGAVHRNFSPDPESIVTAARDGTRNVLEAASKAGVRRVVVTSTAATMGFARSAEHPLDESAHIGQPRSPYLRGKLEAERIAIDTARASSLEVIVVNPSGVFGPLDYRITPATRALVGLLSGDPAFITVSVTDVRDVARAHVLALERGESGERYLITGETVVPRALSSLVREIAGVRPLPIRPPGFLLQLLATLAERKAVRDRADAPITRDMLHDLGGGHLAYDSTRSRRELGVSYRPAREVLTDAFRWLLYLDALPASAAGRVRAAMGGAPLVDPEWET